MNQSHYEVQQQRRRGEISLSNIIFRNRRRLIGIGCLYAVGIYVAFFASGMAISDEGLQKYEFKMIQVEQLHQSSEWKSTMTELQDLEYKLYNAKVWFWWFRPEARQKVNYIKREYENQKYFARELLKEESQLEREAKGFLGLWSHQGVKDSKRMFWQAFDQGKLFARRQTMWDAIFQLLNNREEDWMIRLVQLVLTGIMNFTTGMFLSVILYIIGLPKLIWSYNAGWVSGFVFFLISFLGALAVVVSFLLAMFGAGSVFVYAAAKNIESRGRLGYNSQRRRLNYNRRHYD
eukprot:TRINITY_DN544_c3_g1_i1.p1 TRINITY_DN544_c3_g1~~TRINITY_DN544_c3_g1_i1.p1  ORF type:complete len:291 (-),score=23.27 TRINITY_DN544_c3_g1_i1:285-1157(-)